MVALFNWRDNYYLFTNVHAPGYIYNFLVYCRVKTILWDFNDNKTLTI